MTDDVQAYQRVKRETLGRLRDATRSGHLSAELKADLSFILHALNEGPSDPDFQYMQQRLEVLLHTTVHSAGKLKVDVFAGVTHLKAGELVGWLSEKADGMCLICPISDPTTHIAVERDLVNWWTGGTGNPVIRNSSADPMYTFKVRDYTTELVGRYSKDRDAFYVQRGDGECDVYERYRVAYSAPLNRIPDKLFGEDALPELTPSNDDPQFEFRLESSDVMLMGRYKREHDVYYIQCPDGCHVYRARQVVKSRELKPQYIIE